MIILPIVIIVLALGVASIYLDFLVWLGTGENYFGSMRRVSEKLVILFVLVTLLLDLGDKNDCCESSALFSPAHRLTPDVLILACIAAYLYSVYRKKLGPPLLEICVNCLLLTGLPLNILVGIQNDFSYGWWLGHVPLCMLLVIAIVENHWLAMGSVGEKTEGETTFIAICRRILYLPGWQKFPILLVLCLPLLAILLSILLLFGQKPDSIVRAFTDTYKHGFSQLDYECDNVHCGGHFLCSVAAKGHPFLVKPLRTGFRGGTPIQCNRQLLVSNAFEELLEQRLPALHRPIRRLYNCVGKFVHRYYGIFDKVWIADIVYLIMKPLEWGFVLTLYLCDRHPENRIAQQYLPWEDRRQLRATADDRS
jgi:hypothetical protein